MSGLGRDRLLALAGEKLSSAGLLLHAGHWTDAYYLAGYAVELHLKSRIATRFRADTIPEPKLVRGLYTHDIGSLVVQAGLAASLAARRDESAAFKAAWAIVSEWTEASRYGNVQETEAQAMMMALTEPNDGVLTWLRSLT